MSTRIDDATSDRGRLYAVTRPAHVVPSAATTPTTSPSSILGSGTTWSVRAVAADTSSRMYVSAAASTAACDAAAENSLWLVTQP